MMQDRVFLQPAFVLHTRPFRESSLLVDLLTQDFGRVAVVARGARAQHSRYRGFLRPFVPIAASWSGRSELGSLNQVEQGGAPFLLEGRSLLAGMYLNELLVRLLHQHDPHSDLFNHYQFSLNALNQTLNSQIEPILRQFEKNLLVALGFGFSWTQTTDTLAPIISSQHYAFDPDLGFTEKCSPSNQQPTYPGAHLMAIANNTFDSADVLRTAKQIMRTALQLRLGHRVIKSRELFI
jgi:DNA repair protein RecO (recombination protein O)